MAPAGWRLQRYEKGSAEYAVSIVQISSNKEASDALGAITLDDRNENVVKPSHFKPGAVSMLQQKFRQPMKNFPDVEEFEKFIDAGPMGFSFNENREIYSLNYFNNDRKIYCFGHRPGQSHCYWRVRNRRFSLHFSSKDTEFILTYILKLSAE